MSLDELDARYEEVKILVDQYTAEESQISARIKKLREEEAVTRVIQEKMKARLDQLHLPASSAEIALVIVGEQLLNGSLLTSGLITERTVRDALSSHNILVTFGQACEVLNVMKELAC